MVSGRVVSVNVGRPRVVPRNGEPATTAIWKTPVTGRVDARGHNLTGDDQADRAVHGGPDKAVYSYAVEDIGWWERELGHPLGPGTFGENLTVEGVDLAAAIVGERWRIGTAVLEVSEPRLPCWKLGLRMGDPRFPQRFTKAGRPGTYLRIVGSGELGAGDDVAVARPANGLTIGEIWRIYHDRHADATPLVDDQHVGEGWRDWAQRRLDRAEAR